MATKNRQLAEQSSPREYFHYYPRDRYYQWHTQLAKVKKMSQVICPHCDTYVPRRDASDPLRATKAHIKKSHPRIWHQEYGKPFIILEDYDPEIGRVLSGV